MHSTFAAPDLRNISNPKEFAASHYATLKRAMGKGGADVPGYQPLAHEPKESFVKNNQQNVSSFLGNYRMVPKRRELQLNMMTAGADYRSAKYLQIDARVQPGLWTKEMFSVTHVAGKGALITRLIMPRPWNPKQLEIHQVNLPDDSRIPPTYSKRVGPDFALEESSPGQESYPRQLVWGMFDSAKELDPALRIPGRSLDALAADFDNALCGIKPPYWDGQPRHQ